MAILTRTSENKKQNVDTAHRWQQLRVFLCLSLVAIFCLLPIASHAERIKDIASFEGMRDNQLVGFGLVAGLAGVGDTGNQTIDVMVNMLKRMGATVPASDIKTKDVAAVIITASLPPFPKPGMKLDALVSAIGDAKSLQGGTLLLAPLKGPDGKVYALAQGAVSVGGFIGGGGGTWVQKEPYDCRQSAKRCYHRKRTTVHAWLRERDQALFTATGFHYRDGGSPEDQRSAGRRDNRHGS